MLVTLSTAQPPMSWLNDEAEENMNLMLVTLSTAQPPMSWLKDDAPEL
jgi:hypothetical protein